MLKIALIPSYQPDDKLINLVKELKKEEYIIVVINDGSGEKYNNIFEQVEEYAKVISYNKNKGKGYALKKGISYISKNFDKYIIVTIDGDGQHKVKDASKLYNYNINHLNELVLGCRIRDKKIPLKSKIGNSLTRFIYKLISRNDIYDTQTGLRSFSYKLVDYMLSLDGDRYEFEMNMLIYLKDNNIHYKEIIIESIYYDNNNGTHFRPIKDSYLVYKELLKYSLSSFFSFIIDYSLYIVFILFTSNIIVSNVLSRIISASVNYNINKKIVFKSSNKYKSILEYIVLVIIILILNTYILNILTNIFSINIYMSKIITELALSLFSFIIQKNIIFKKKVIL